MFLQAETFHFIPRHEPLDDSLLLPRSPLLFSGSLFLFLFLLPSSFMQDEAQSSF